MVLKKKKKRTILARVSQIFGSPSIDDLSLAPSKALNVG